MNQLIVFLTLAGALVLFMWGKLRHDLVALFALFALVIAGIVPADRAFVGFAHPAVVTVAAVLIISRALADSGLIDLASSQVIKLGKSVVVQVVSLTVLIAVASAFMNNVGALAILMPVALRIARKSSNPPSYILMPIAFGSLLGGMTTLIGTPPNIIIAAFRADQTGEPFGMFAFSPVGVGVAALGVAFISLAGWRLLPKRRGQSSPEDLFRIEDYITEVRVTKDSRLKGKPVGEIDRLTGGVVRVVGLIRKKRRINIPDAKEELKTHDILILEADSADLKDFVNSSGVKLVGGRQFRRDAIGSKDIVVNEAVVMANSPLVGNTAAGLSLRTRYGLNLLAVARRDKKLRRRIDNIRFQVGDVLLLQGRTEQINDAVTAMGCLPLVERGLKIGQSRRIILALGIFGGSIASVVAGLLPVQAAFPLAALVLVVSNVISPRDIYESVDWPVIILLGAMIPVGGALETTGAAELIAAGIMRFAENLPAGAAVAIILLASMLLSNVVNNAATVVLMAPIGVGLASGLAVSVDPFLMAIAVGASSPFLTPIGHQSNTLVMSPGGYKFSDYWRMGLPMSIIVPAAAVPLILWFWPL